MSIILDALRKSENERQRGTPPGLAEARYAATPGRRSLWIPIVFAVLLANLVLMSVWWYQSTADQPPPQVSVPLRALPNEPERMPTATAVQTRPPPAIRSLDQEAATPRPPPVNRAAAQARNRPAERPAPVDNTPAEELPDLTQLTLSGDIVLPPMHIDLHVYSTNPDSRLVFINSARYREGDRLEEGPVIAAITPAGVILEHQGRRFTLPKE